MASVPNLTLCMSLPGLSVDVVGFIAFLLDGCEIFRLKLCGSAQLWTKIVASRPKLRIHLAPLSPFPFSAFNMPQLTYLKVSFASQSPACLAYRIPLPSQPIPTLESLEFNFLQSLRVLGLDNARPNLNTYFCNLRRLELSGNGANINEEHILALPRSLQVFAIRCEEEKQLASVHYLALLHVPPQLMELTIECMIVQASKDSNTFEGLVWPPTLTKLCVTHFANPSIFRALPRTVQELEIGCAEFSGSYKAHTSDLPPSVTKFKISYGALRSAAFEMVSDGVFPPNLVEYDTLAKYERMEDLVGLPSSVEKLNYSHELLRTPELIAKFPKLRVAPYYYGITAPFPHFPPLLEKLSLAAFEANLIPWSALPRSLTSLYAPLSTVEQVLALPKSITHLHITQSSVILDKEFFGAFWPLLTDLSFELACIASSDTLAHLPTTLEALTLRLQQKTPQGIEMEKSLFHYLPVLHRLHSLYFYCYSSDFEWRSWLLELEDGKKTPVLREISSYLAITSSASQDTTNSHLRHLPRTLRYLTIHVTAGIEKDLEILSHLPPHLQSLSLFPISSQVGNHLTKVGLYSEQLQYLPKSITYLDICRLDVFSPSTSFMDHLPPGIANVHIPETRTSQEELKKYYAAPIWEGTRTLSGFSL